MSENAEKVIILGARGMLGSDVVRECEQRGIAFEALDLPEFDITDVRQLGEVVRRADAIINCAAYTDVEKAESETEKAYQINAEAVGRLGVAARKKGAWVLHISTDFVFDGNGNKPYAETDMPDPINAYGRTKLAGEMLLIESRGSHCVLRLEWTYGINGDNFVKKLLNKAKEQAELKVVDDQVGSPTATTEAAKAICEILRKKPKGVLHFSALGYASRFEVAKFIIDKKQLGARIVPCKTADYPTAAARPLNSRFDCGKIRELLDAPIRTWQSPLEEFLRQL